MEKEIIEVPTPEADAIAQSATVQAETAASEAETAATATMSAAAAQSQLIGDVMENAREDARQHANEAAVAAAESNMAAKVAVDSNESLLRTLQSQFESLAARLDAVENKPEPVVVSPESDVSMIDANEPTQSQGEQAVSEKKTVKRGVGRNRRR